MKPMKKLRAYPCSVISFLLTVLPAANCYGQVISDPSVGSRVTPQGNTFLIDGGTTKGANLFHSFEQFSVPTNRTAFFNNNVSIQHIFSRVKGSSAANIDGILRTNANASLFLLSPNGIVFGNNARLEIGGSFLGTTASSIQFEDGKHFSGLGAQPLLSLTDASPTSIHFGQSSGDIQVSGSGNQLSIGFFSPISREGVPQGLQVSSGKTLALLGGNITLDGGELIAPGGRIELGSVAQGKVSVNTSAPRWSFGYSPETSFDNIQLMNRASLDTSGLGGASIGIFGQQIILNQNSVVVMQNRGVSPDGALIIEATDLIDFRGADTPGAVPTGLYSETVNLGASAPMSLFAPNIVIREGSILDTRTFTPARGGDLIIAAPSSFTILGASAFNPGRIAQINSLTFSLGKAGDITIDTPKLAINEGGRLSTLTFGQGVGGKISIQAQSVDISGFDAGSNTASLQGSTIQAGTFGTGNAGSLLIDASRVSLGNGGSLSATTLSSGNGGDIIVNARQSLEISGIGPEANLPSIITAEANQVDPLLQQLFMLPPLPSGNAGSVTIKTPRLVVADEGRISVLNNGLGDAGELQIFTNLISVSNGSSLVASTNSGNGGDILIRSQLLKLKNAEISASAMGSGTGGNVVINSGIVASLGDSIISANAEDNQGGNININALGLFLSPNSQITATSQLGTQFDGNVDVEAEITNFSRDPNLKIQIDPPELYSVCGDSNTTALAYYRIGTAGKPTSPITRSPADGGWLQAAKARYDQRHITYVDPETGEVKPLKRVVGWKTNPNGTITFVNDPRTADQYAPAVAAQLKACHTDQQAKAG